MGKQIAVLSTGAIGSSIGADLTHAGYNVSLIDQWPAHVEAMKANGLRVTMPDSELHTKVNAYHLCELSSLNRRFDIVLLAAKSQDTRWMTEFIKPYLKDDGMFVGTQNGMNNADIIDIIGKSRVMGCALELSAEVFTPGLVQRNTDPAHTWFGLGEFDGSVTPRLTELEKLLKHSGKITITDNIEGAKWTKLVNSSMILAPFGMLGLQSWQAVQIPEVCNLCAKLASETMRVGTAHGYKLDAIFGLSPEEFLGPEEKVIDKLLFTILGHLGKKGSRTARGVVLQDFLKGRKTETDFLNGHIARKGRDANIATPANDAVVELCRRIERGELKPDRSNIELITKRLS
ncbi:MAG: 2-dehydropantoate 2-reductase N-terminal domain-containing protein [Burkholderiales bacterium]